MFRLGTLQPTYHEVSTITCNEDMKGYIKSKLLI